MNNIQHQSNSNSNIYPVPNVYQQKQLQNVSGKQNNIPHQPNLMLTQQEYNEYLYQNQIKRG